MLHALLSLMWLMIIWGICGCAIARIAIVQVAKLRQTGAGEALRFSLRSWSHLIVPSLCPLLGLAISAAVTAAFGLLYRLPVAGPALAGAMLVVPLAAGLMMILLVAGLVAGWPLMHAAVAAGAEDALDAMSRTFGYLNQRIGPFLALLVFVWLEGIDWITVGGSLGRGCDWPDAVGTWLDRARGPHGGFVRRGGCAGGPDGRRDSRLLAGGGAAAGSWLDLQLLLDGGGAPLSLAAARRRRHALERDRAAWNLLDHRAELDRRGCGQGPRTEYSSDF